MNFQPRTQGAGEADQNAAYRRLVAVVLRLDVATLAHELKQQRLQAQLQQSPMLAHAA
jgi:hypothetical protein